MFWADITNILRCNTVMQRLPGNWRVYCDSHAYSNTGPSLHDAVCKSLVIISVRYGTNIQFYEDTIANSGDENIYEGERMSMLI